MNRYPLAIGITLLSISPLLLAFFEGDEMPASPPSGLHLQVNRTEAMAGERVGRGDSPPSSMRSKFPRRFAGAGYLAWAIGSRSGIER